MDAILVEVAADGRVRFEDGTWTKPSVQERRAIIHAAQSEVAELNDLLEVLERPAQ